MKKVASTGCLEVHYQGHSLVTFRPAPDQPLWVKKFKPAPGQAASPWQSRRPAPTHEKPQPAPIVKVPYKPAANHPWRRYGATLKERQENGQEIAK